MSLFAQPQRGSHPADVFERLAELGRPLRHPHEIQPRTAPFHRNGCGTDVQSEDPIGSTRGDGSLPRERERAADDRMPRHRQLGPGREDSHARVGARPLGAGHERRLGKTDFAGDLLHGRRRQSGSLRKDGKLVAAKAAVGEYVVVDVPIPGNAHARMFILSFTVHRLPLTFAVNAGERST